MICSPSWLEVDAILGERSAPTPPTFTPPAEAALSQQQGCLEHLVRQQTTPKDGGKTSIVM